MPLRRAGAPPRNGGGGLPRHGVQYRPHGGGDPEQRLRGTYTVRSTITFGDWSATYHEAGHFTNIIISGLESGVHTHLNVETGLRGAIRGPGGLIVRDAGVITFEVTFDANDEVTDVQVIDVKGPHDLFDAGDFSARRSRRRSVSGRARGGVAVRDRSVRVNAVRDRLHRAAVPVAPDRFQLYQTWPRCWLRHQEQRDRTATAHLNPAASER